MLKIQKGGKAKVSNEVDFVLSEEIKEDEYK